MRGFTGGRRGAGVGQRGLDSPGLDLLAAFIGSEGLLGVVTEVTVRLLPKPQVARCLLASFDDVSKAGNTVARHHWRRPRFRPGLEMMDRPMTQAVETSYIAGYDLQAEPCAGGGDGTAEEWKKNCTADRGAAGSRRHKAGRRQTEASACAPSGQAQKCVQYHGPSARIRCVHGRIHPAQTTVATMLQTIQRMQQTRLALRECPTQATATCTPDSVQRKQPGRTQRARSFRQ